MALQPNLQKHQTVELLLDSQRFRLINENKEIDIEAPEKQATVEKKPVLNPIEVFEQIVSNEWCELSDPINQHQFQLEIKSELALLALPLGKSITNELEQTAIQQWKNTDRTFEELFRSHQLQLQQLERNLHDVIDRKSQGDLLQDIKRLLDPNLLIMDINIIWSFVNFQVEYEAVTGRFFQQGFIKDKAPYKMDPDITSNIETIFNQRIANIAKAIHKFNQTFDQFQQTFPNLMTKNSVDFQAQLLTLIKSLNKTNHDDAFNEPIVQAWQDIKAVLQNERKQLEQLLVPFYQLLYTNFVTTLRETMKKQQKTLTSLSLTNGEVQFTYEATEREQVKSELAEIVDQLELYLSEKKWLEIKQIVARTKPITKANAELNQLQLRPGKSVDYLFHLIESCVSTTELLQNKNGNELSFLHAVTEKISREQVIINDDDINEYEVATQFELAAHFIHTAITLGEEKRIIAYFDYMMHALEKYENDQLHSEEKLSKDFTILIVLAAIFLKEKYEHPFIVIALHHDLTPQQIKEVLVKYKQTVATDDFYRFFNQGILNKLGGDMLRTVINALPKGKN